MIYPNSPEEIQLEQRAFDMVNNVPGLPEAAKDLIKTLWNEVVDREQWFWKVRESEGRD